MVEGSSRQSCPLRVGSGLSLIVLLLLSLALLIPGPAWAADAKTKAKQKPTSQASEKVEPWEEQSHSFGYRPTEEHTKSIHGANEGDWSEGALVPMASMPSSYKSIEHGVLTPIKDQNPFGSCWTFSVMAASESSIISKGKLLQGTVPDFSERQLAYFTYNPVNDPLGNLQGDKTIPSDFYLELGGNEKLASYTLASWSGVVDESTAPYSELVSAYEEYSDTDEFLGATALQADLSRGSDVAHLTDVRQIPMHDRDDVKQAIMEYGAVDSALLYEDEYYNPETNALYNDEEASTNHAIALVGWDDDFSKENFVGSTFYLPEGEIELPDTYEDLRIGRTVTISGPEEELNWLTFTPTKDGLYTFYSSDSEGDPYVELYALNESSGLLQRLSSDDDSQGDHDFSLSEWLTAGKTYYLYCRAYEGDASYTVSVYAEDVDEVEGDTELPASSSPIALDVPTAVSSGTWLTFTPAESGYYVFESTDYQNDPYAILYVLADNGMLAQVATGDDNGEDWNFLISYELTAGETYYLDCSTNGNGEVDSYTVSVTVGDEPVVEVDKTEPPASYSPITLDVPTAVSSGTWLTFTPAESGYYVFESTDYQNDPYGRLYVLMDDGMLAEVASDDDSGDERNFFITCELMAGETYYLECSTFGSDDDVDSYTVTVTADSGSDEPGEDGVEPPEQTQELTIDSPIQINVAGDGDCTWLRLTPTQDGSYTFSGSCDTGYGAYVYCVSPDNGLLGYVIGHEADDGDSDSLTTNLKGGVTYFVQCEVGIGQSCTFSVVREGDAVEGGPSEDGAWLVRNSWGEESNDEGYFWASYEDWGLNGSDEYPGVATTFEYGSVDDFDNIYQYDGSCASCYTDVESGGRIANVFEAKANERGVEQLGAISFWMEDVNVDYSVQIYTGVQSASDPTDGTPALAEPVTGKTSYEGYYTVNLPSPVILNEGDRFAVVITVSHEDDSPVAFGLDETTDQGWVSFESTVLPGQSYRDDSGSWVDMSTVDSDKGNLRIKAFTSNEAAGTHVPITNATVSVQSPQTYTGSPIRPKVTVTLNGKSLVAGIDYAVTYSNNVEVGTATVTITGRGNYTGTRRVTFRIVPAAPFFLDARPGDDRNHGTEVDWMGRSGISTGWEVAGGREFRGLWDVKRCDFAAFLYRMADLSDDGERNDSCALEDWEVEEVLEGVSDCGERTSHAPEIAWMIDEGISRGWPNADGTVSFRPMANVARQDMAAFLYRYADIQDDGLQDQSLEPGAESVAFRDVRHGDAGNHAPEVEWLASVGVTKGWGPMADGRYEFRGRNNVKRQDMAAFLYRLNAYLNR